MALAASGTYAATAATALVAQLASDVGETFDETVARITIEPVLDSIEALIRSMLSDAEVDLAVGQFSGADSSGDTMTGVSASGGNIT